ncbi:hypothetical protein Nepgr_021705 [Nepenthes gracilis]|uniref:Uncharacterized protein n=1 Tax=Nepenthes gracilis TaxID=150966 RepID=A0AAD3SZR3_NEPGR|nr:hypothetical protein Nepgr_021705 [Nepenthes gracilis]
MEHSTNKPEIACLKEDDGMWQMVLLYLLEHAAGAFEFVFFLGKVSAVALGVSLVVGYADSLESAGLLANSCSSYSWRLCLFSMSANGVFRCMRWSSSVQGNGAAVGSCSWVKEPWCSLPYETGAWMSYQCELMIPCCPVMAES